MIINYIILILYIYFSCKISGNEFGECKNINQLDKQIIFCKDVLEGDICVPSSQILYECSVKIINRDNIIEKIFMENIANRLLNELDITKNYNKNNLIINEQCLSSYKTILCRWNFPKCNNKNETIPVCNSICLNYMNQCGYSADKCTIDFNSPPLLNNGC